MKRLLSLVALFLVFTVISPSSYAGDEFIYKSKNKIDYIKLTKASKSEKEGGLKHPYTFPSDQIRAILRSIKFNKKIMLLKDIENRALFDEQNVEFLAANLEEAFKKVGPEQVVVVSYFTRDTHVVIQDDRLTVMRAFMKDDGLHISFLKTYAKLLGDRGTAGVNRMTSDAHGLRVSLEVGPGQNRVGWKPEQLVFDLNAFSNGSVASADKKDGKKDKKGKVIKEEPVEAQSEPEKKIVKKTKTSEPAASGEKTVRDRIKELDQLKKDELITDKEYQEKRKELLKSL